MKAIRSLLILSIATCLVVACAANSPPLTGTPPPAPAQALAAPKPDPKSFEKSFAFANSEFTDTQASYNENQISLVFQVAKDGQSVNGLTEPDLQVKENGITIPQFKLSADTQHLDQVVEVALVLDITASMGPFLESAKTALRAFEESSRQNGYHLRFCIATFGDWTVDHCTRFFDNTSDDQMKEFLTELNRLYAHQGKDDPGWPDIDENPMRALMDTNSEAPWTPGAQRFAIVVTDAPFLYEPGNPSKHPDKPESKAPQMPEVTASIKASGVNVFAVTPNHAGYNSPFHGEPGITQSSGGEFFEFKKVISGKIKLDHILDRILNRVKTTYHLSYVVDKVAGLDPTLPLSKRQVTVTTAKGIVDQRPASSSMPTGRPQYKQVWKVSNQPILAGSTQVYLNGDLVKETDYSLNGTEVHFKAVPPAGAKIKVVFQYEAIEKNMRLEPMVIPGVTDARTTKVYLNGREARAEDLIFERTIEGNTGLRLADSVLANNDPYDIRRNKGVKIKVVTNFAL